MEALQHSINGTSASTKNIVLQNLCALGTDNHTDSVTEMVFDPIHKKCNLIS